MDLARRRALGIDLDARLQRAGKGDQRLMPNGAPMIGTLDGTDAEIGEETDKENFFRFELAAHEIEGLWPNAGPCNGSCAESRRHAGWSHREIHYRDFRQQLLRPDNDAGDERI
jgi:hypothetical protein